MGTKPGAGKGLRIATGCSTLDEFTAVFRKFCTPNSIFIATRSPRERGIDTRFAITLKDAKPVLRGSGTIVESYPTADNAYGRPGMVIEFIKLDAMGRILLDELNAGPPIGKVEPSESQKFELPTVVKGPEREVLAGARRSAQIEAPKAEEGEEDQEEAAADESPPSAPSRTEGSKLVLPANPFSALSASSLEAFVECTLYEETGDIDIAGVVAELSQGGPLEDPILASELLDVNPLKDPPVARGAVAPAFDSAPDALDTEEARAIAAAQVAEDKRPKFIPRPPKLPNVPLAEPADESTDATAPAEDRAPRPSSSAPFAPPASLATLAESPSSSSTAMPPPGPPMGMPQAGSLARIPVIHPVNAMAPAPAERPMVGPHGLQSAGPVDRRYMSAPSKWLSALPRSVTRNQALAFAGLCLVAGLGFGALVGDDAAPADDTAAAASSSKLTGDTRPAGTELPSTEAATADAGLVETEPEAEAAMLADAAPADEEPADEEPEEMIAATDAPCIVTLDILPTSAEVTIAAVTSEASAGEMLVPCGEHEVTIEHPRYQKYAASFEVLPGEAGLLRARLARPSVYLRIESTPAKAEVTINSRRVGTTPLRHKLPAFQAAKVQVSSPGYKSYSTKYYVKKAGTLRISLRKNTRKRSTNKSSTSRRSATR